MSDDIAIEVLTPLTEADVTDLIGRNLEGYEEAGSVLAAIFRRLSNLGAVYHATGARYFILRERATGVCIGGAGIGSLHGLPPSEGQGELRDLVLDPAYRGKGYGARLLKRCIEEAKQQGYQRLYLETTPQMETAQKLFIRFGFRPVTGMQDKSEGPKVPGYYILEHL